MSPDLREKLPLTVSHTRIRCGRRGRRRRGQTCSPSSLPCVSSQKSVRLVVNYLRTQKAVVRVSPEVPLHSLLPVICAKCDVSPEHVVLLRDNVAGEELELSKSLSELGIKELYAWDNKRGEAPGTRGSTRENAGARGNMRHVGACGSTWGHAGTRWSKAPTPMLSSTPRSTRCPVCARFQATGMRSRAGVGGGEGAGNRPNLLSLPGGRAASHSAPSPPVTPPL